MNLINLTTEIFEVDHLRVKSRRKLQSTEGTPQISRRSFWHLRLFLCYSKPQTVVLEMVIPFPRQKFTKGFSLGTPIFRQIDFKLVAHRIVS